MKLDKAPGRAPRTRLCARFYLISPAASGLFWTVNVRSHVQHLATVVYRVSPTLQRLRRVRRELLPPLFVLVSRAWREHRRRCDDIASKTVCCVPTFIATEPSTRRISELIARDLESAACRPRDSNTSETLFKALLSLQYLFYDNDELFIYLFLFPRRMNEFVNLNI